MTYKMLVSRDLQPDTHSLWRYQPLPRLEDLLQRRAQFFPSLGTLSKTMDHLEGQLTELNFTHPELEVNRVWVEQLADFNGRELYETLDRSFTDSKTLLNLQFLNQTHGYANCWYEGEEENPKLWKDFTDDIGIVIKTVIGRLKRCFASAPGHQYVDRVQYRDIELGGEPVPIDWIQALLTKDKKWEDQREVRAFMMALDAREVFKPIDTGVFVPVLPNILIQRVHVAPRAPQSTMERVRAALDTAGLMDVPVARSALTVAHHS